MNTYLLRFETYGIKNIEKKIILNFANKSITSKNLKYTKIKGIFGGNGAGKSAIIDSFYVYEHVMNEENFLLQDKTTENLNNLFNKNSKEIYFKAYFALVDKKSNRVECFCHELILKKNERKFCIFSERFAKLKGRTIDSATERLIFETKNGELKYLFDDSCFDKIKDITNNLLSFKSLSNLKFYIDLVIRSKKNDQNKYDSYLINFVPLFAFGLSINTFLVNEDINILNRDTYEEFLKKNKILRENSSEKFTFILETSNTDKILKKDFEQYKHKIEKLTAFIKIFKPNLVRIDIDKKVDGKFYNCKKIFNYGKYKVDIEYESTGIKKLVELYPALNMAINGGIVFVDELDANINGVFLNKLIEFIEDEGQGQLCFTSHNLEPLTILKSKLHSINFIGQTGKNVNWASNGNYSPRTLYLEGMIEDSPFNFESFDFLRAFDIRGD